MPTERSKHMDLMQNEKFRKILSEVDKDWSVEERVRYVLQEIGICDETIIHIVTKGVTIENLCEYTLWQNSGFLANFTQKCKELFDAINDFIRKNDITRDWTEEERIRYELQKAGVDDKIIRIIMAGSKIANLYEHTLCEEAEFPQDFHEGCRELSSSINFLIDEQKVNNTVGVITFITILQKNIIKDNEIKRAICLFH